MCLRSCLQARLAAVGKAQFPDTIPTDLLSVGVNLQPHHLGEDQQVSVVLLQSDTSLSSFRSHAM